MRNIDKRPGRTRPLLELVKDISLSFWARGRAEGDLRLAEYYGFVRDMGLSGPQGEVILAAYSQRLRPTAEELKEAKDEIIKLTTGEGISAGIPFRRTTDDLVLPEQQDVPEPHPPLAPYRNGEEYS